MNTFEIRPLACAAAPFSSLVHSRLLTDAASLEAALPHFLGNEEGIEYWMRFSAGKMTSGEGAGHCGQRRGTNRW